MHEILLSRLEQIADHVNHILIYSSQISIPSDFSKNIEGIKIYDAVLMRLQALGENLKNTEQKNPRFLLNIPKWNGEKLSDSGT